MQKWTRVMYQPNVPLGENGEKVTACKKHIELSKEAAKEGMVLLKNDKQVLPLAKGSKVALFGKASFEYVRGGGGSGEVTVSYARNLYEGLQLVKDKVSVFEELSAYYRDNVKAQYQAGRVPGMTIEPEVPADLLKKARAYTDTAIITICRFSGEGWDRKSTYDKKEEEHPLFEDGDFYLSHAEKAMVASLHIITIAVACATIPSPKIKNRKLNGLIKKYKKVPVTSTPPTRA